MQKKRVLALLIALVVVFTSNNILSANDTSPDSQVQEVISENLEDAIEETVEEEEPATDENEELNDIEEESEQTEPEILPTIEEEIFTGAADAQFFSVNKIVQFEDGVVSSAYEINTAESALGGKYVYVPSSASSGDLASPWSWDKSPAGASFTFDIPADGTYYLWFRYHNSAPGNTGTRSWWLKWDGDPTEQADWSYAGWGIDMTDFEWTRSADGYGFNNGSRDVIFLTAGTHTLYFTHRQRGMSLDALYLSTEQTMKPPSSLNFQVNKPAMFTDAKLADYYEVRSSESALSGYYVYVPGGSTGAPTTPSGSGNMDDPWNYPVGASFTFDIPENGTYYLWHRYHNSEKGNTGTRSWWIKWDGDPAEQTRWAYAGWGIEMTDFEWTRSADGYGYNNGMNHDSVFLTAGTHTLYFTHRQRGMSMDAVYLSTDPTRRPDADPDDGITRELLPSGVYPVPSLLPPEGVHPRLLFKAEDIPGIIENYYKPQNAAAKAAFESLVSSGFNGIPSGSNTNQNYNGQDLGKIEAMALSYALFDDTTSGQSAVDAIKTYLPLVTFPTTGDPYRPMGQVIFVASEVYDWCYDLLSEEDMLYIVYHCERIAKYANGTGMEIGYPPRGQGAIVGHGSEAQLLRDLLGFAVATYDEYPDIYNYVGGRFFNDYITPRNFWYDSNTHHQGSSYGGYRYTWEMWSAFIMKRMSGVDVYSDQMQYVPYEWIYTRRPDGQLFRSGDDYIEGQQTGYFKLSPAFFLASGYFGDEYMKYEALRQNPNLATFGYTNDALTPVYVLLFNDPDLGTRNFNSLPLTKYFASPAGWMAARTGWTEGSKSGDVLALMKITEYWGGNHHHTEAGSFQLYYKGILASNSGFYDSYGSPHDYNYNKRSISNNTLSIFDPNESFGSRANDGGQRLPGNASEPATMDIWMRNDEYLTGKVLGEELGPDLNYPEYTYVKGDITNAYSSKASEVLRSMVFLPLDDPNHPAAMIVMDKMTSTNASFKKSFLLHMQQEPSVNGNKSTIVNTLGANNGKMVNETLLPKNASIEMIGGPGKEFMVGGVNYPISGSVRASMEPGWGRIEISPEQGNLTDYFLNVMTVSDADSTAADLTSILLEGDSWVGAVVSNRVAIFAKDSARIDSDIRFTIPGEGSFKVFAAGIKEGTWLVNGSKETVATVDGGVVYFDAQAGEVILTYLNGNTERPPVDPLPPDESRSGNILRVGNSAIYCDIDPIATGDTFLVQGTEVFEALMATGIVYDKNTKTLTGVTKEGVLVSVTDGSNIAGFGTGIIPLTIAPREVNGVLAVPLELFETAFYTSWSWDRSTYTLTLQAGNKPQTAAVTAEIIGCDYSGHFEGEVGENSYDGNIDYPNGTLWSVDGVNGAWIWYEFKETSKIKSALIHFNNYNARQTEFKLSYSSDGENWIEIGTFISDGKTYGETIAFAEPVDAKFIRYDFIRNINSGSTFCAIRNIAFLVEAPEIESVTVISGAVLPGTGGSVTVEISGVNLEGQVINLTLDGVQTGASAVIGQDGKAHAIIPIPANTGDKLIFHTIEVWLNGAATGEKTYVAVNVDDTPPPPVYDIKITAVTNGNGQANADFKIRSANGKGYSVYLSQSGTEGTFKLYSNVNYNSKGAHIKGLTNGTTYYIYIVYESGSVYERSGIAVLKPSK